MSIPNSGSSLTDLGGDSGVYLETVETGDEEASRGSSVASNLAAPPDRLTSRDLVDLTGGNKCRVILQSSSPPRVCGGELGSCGRPRHNQLSQEEARRAQPGFYVAAYSDARTYPDGYLECDVFTLAQVEAMKVAERREAEVLCQALSGGEEVTFVGPPTQPSGSALDTIPRGDPDAVDPIEKIEKILENLKKCK